MIDMTVVLAPVYMNILQRYAIRAMLARLARLAGLSCRRLARAASHMPSQAVSSRQARRGQQSSTDHTGCGM